MNLLILNNSRKNVDTRDTFPKYLPNRARLGRPRCNDIAILLQSLTGTGSRGECGVLARCLLVFSHFQRHLHEPNVAEKTEHVLGRRLGRMCLLTNVKSHARYF